MKPHKISIITVTYNAEKWLERTILSVQEQLCDAIEYIIIDGGSTDGTLDIINKYTSVITSWQSEPDKGLYDAMNKGLQKATGDYIWFLNAGDSIYNHTVVKTLSQLIESNAYPDIVYGETDLVGADNTFVGHRRLKAPENLTWKSFKMGMLVSHQAFIVKREIAPLYDLKFRLSSDFDWCIKCMKKAKSIVNAHSTLVNYLYEGLTTNNRKASLKERYVIMKKYYGAIQVSMLHVWFAVRFYWAKLVRGIV